MATEPMATEPMADQSARSWARAGSIRARLTILAMALVGVTALIGAVALVTTLRSTLTESVLADTRMRAAEMAAALEDDTPPAELGLGASDDLLIQVMDANGVLVAAGGEAPSAPLAEDLAPGGSRTLDVPGDDDPFMVVAADAHLPDGRYRVLVGRALDLVEESTGVVTLLLAVGVPLLVIVVGVVAWLLVGRALAPVEAIRAEVAEISAAELHRRVPTPPGGDEIARLAVTMNDMLTRLDRAQARQRQLVADTSHELRSPIASIRQHAEVTLAHPERTTTTELASTVLAEDLRLARMVDDLLLLARADERSLHLEHRPIDLDDVVLEAARALRLEHRLEIDASGISAGRVLGDAGAMQRLVDNLAENAARHARHRISLSLGREGSSVRLRVEDDGPGIPLADRQRVFERFVRLDDARARDTGGSGLGLAIVAELVAAHGGSVQIGDSPLGGASVDVVLPSAADD